MAKNIKFHPRDPVPKKVKPVQIKQRGKRVEFAKEQFAAQPKTEDTHGEVNPTTGVFFGCF